MVDTDVNVWKDIVQLAKSIDTVSSKHLGKSIDYAYDTELVNDLGLVGDDAHQFMEDFASMFNVERGDYNPENYFENEGLWILPTFKNKNKKKPITLGMLLLAAQTGTWETATLNDAYLKKQYLS